MAERQGASGRVAQALLLAFISTVVAVGSPAPARATDPVTTLIAQYQEQIPELMAQQDVPGLAVALVNSDRPLWVQGFGHRGGSGDAPATVDTIFSAQSMSKTFTATAVLQAVAAGHLDLDEPITTYLPEFTVHSVFEEHPERRITLRMLLGHTAGFTHEAPVGNNNDLDPSHFDAHVRSISDTWMRFPVGSGYAYSNLGFDLAGYILQRVEGRPFAEVMRDSLLVPLGMENSTFDRTLIRSSADRAEGHVDPYPTVPVDVAMTAAGGLYTSAEDLARFLRFQLNDGSIDNQEVLEPRWMDVMRKVVAPHPGAPSGAALGVFRTRWNRLDQRPDLFEHGGGGYGFISDLYWLPQLHIGIAILTNSQDHQLQTDLALSILYDLLTEPGVYRDRLLALPARPPIVDPNTSYEPPPGMTDLLADVAMDPMSDEDERWAEYSGRYREPQWDVLDPSRPPDRFVVQAGIPYFFTEDDTGTLVQHRLTEVQPGLFLADNGQTLDLRRQDPTWASLRLVRVAGGPAPWQWAILGVAASLSTIWLVAAAGRVRQRRLRSSPTQDAVRFQRGHRIIGAMAALTAVIALGSVVMIAAVPGLVDSGFLGWLEVPMAIRLALHAPLALTLLGACTALLVTFGWFGHLWSGSVRLQYSALAIAAIALVGQFAAWGLIGWGLT